MFKWAQQTLANVAGTKEPVYGPDAIQPVTKQDVPYTELKKEDLKWRLMDSTCVETQTFYMFADNGKFGMAQVIYSKVAPLTTTCQFSAKIFHHPDGELPHLWISDPLQNWRVDDENYSFYADNLALELSEDGTAYKIKSSTNLKAVVELTFKRVGPGFMAGKDGTSYFGEDPANPWGSMRHTFWPRCSVEGSMMTQGGPVDFKGRGIFIHALQGMKPHHLAARWNFVTFHSPAYSAIMMEYTTPESYGSTTVNVGALVTDTGLVIAGPMGPATHTETKTDSFNDWPEPTAASYQWAGKTSDGQVAAADITGSLGPRLDRVDVMVEVPAFVKQIIASAAGTKPYIYQFAPTQTIKVKIGDEAKEEEGQLYTEATFIS